MKSLAKQFPTAVLFPLILSPSCFSQIVARVPECGEAIAGMATNNGIAAGAPKVYDNRSLTLMLDSLNDQLKSIQTVDSKSLAAALSLLQGYQSQDVSRQITAQLSPFAKTSRTTQESTPTDAAGATTSNSSTSTTKTSNEAVGTVPTLPDLPTAPGFTPAFGQNAADLLNDQVNLSYQIFNLRMILERSLSDRLMTKGGKKQPRVQAVLGVNISIDPPRDAEDSAAVVEITLKPARAEAAGRMSLVSMMPQEKTYNSAALSQKSTAFGGSAVAKIIAVGYTERRRGQNFYLFRDNDTTAFEEMTAPGQNELRFGWQFRPVLGRKSVSPGLRQMFAVISLPADDDARVCDPENALRPCEPYQVLASVKTYWRKYDRQSLTTTPRSAIPWWSLGHRPPAGEGTLPQPYCVEVPSTTDFQSALKPVIRDVSTVFIGSKKAMVSIQGQNFFQETKVIFGDKVFDKPENGLFIKSDQAMDVIADLADLVKANGSVLGRYGPAVPLAAAGAGRYQGGIRIAEISDSPPLGGYFDLYVEVTPRLQAQRDSINELLAKRMPFRDKVLPPKISPIISINGVAIPGPYDEYECFEKYVGDRFCRNLGSVVFIARVSTDVVKEMSGTVRLRYPFYGPEWDEWIQLGNPEQKTEITRAGKVGEDRTALWIERKTIPFDTPEGERERSAWCWVLRIPGREPANLTGRGVCTLPPYINPDIEVVLLTPYLAQVTAKTEFLKAPYLLLISPKDEVLILEIPPEKEEAKRPKQSFTLNQNDSTRLEFKPDASEDLKGIAKAFADGVELPIELSPKGDTLFVSMTRASTAKPGQLEIVFRNAKNTPVATRSVTIK